MMKYMLDSDICIYIIKNNPKSVVKKFMRYSTDEIVLSAIAYAELETGVMKSKNVLMNRAALTKMMSGVKIMPFNAAAAETYGSIRAELEREGRTIGPNDMLIAAHAKSLDLTLITNNTKEFERVPGLKIENWV